MEQNILLQASHLSKTYQLGRKKTLQAVSDVSLDIFEGETLALAGESGCGKSTLGKTLIRLKEPTAGEIKFRGETITGLSAKDFAQYRRQMQLVFQDPYASLNPRMTVRDIIAEPLDTYKVCATKQETTDRVVELLEAVGLNADYL